MANDPHPTLTMEDRKQLIARILTPRPEGTADARAIADQAVWSWERIAFHLTPLIGQAGFQSLYFRAVHLSLPQCPTITLLQRGSSTEDLFQHLRSDLALLDAVTTAFCSNVLMNKFLELVASMIGEQLTAQILHSAWGRPPEAPAAQEEDAQ